MGDPETIMPGCYYPGCNEDHAPNKKFCAQHGGSKAMNAPKKTTTKKKAAPKKKTTTKKKAAPKKKTTTKKKAAPKKKAAAKGKATPAQLAAIEKAKQFEKFDWADLVAKFKKVKKKTDRIELGSPGSAQVTRVRLLKRKEVDFNISTEGCFLVFTKGGK